jgi:serralysin
MTYHSYVPSPNQNAPETGYTNETYGYPQTYMMYDIAALQAMYGADFTFRKTNTVYRWSPTTGETFVNGVGQGAPGDGIGGSANRILLTIWDGGGTDTYDFSNYTRKVTIDLNPGGHVTISGEQRAYLGDGHYARGNVFNALQFEGNKRSLIENAKGGSGSDILKGNAVKNTLKGYAGNDILSGGGGKDLLWGGKGKDTFLFNADLNGRSNVDRILDFSPVADTIRLENAVFDTLTKRGKLAKGLFHIGSQAHDRNDRIVYNKKSGALTYDPDGTGSDAPTKFAQLKAGLGMSAADFFVV